MRPLDRRLQQVGLELHQQVVGGRAAVHAEHRHRFADVLRHRLRQIVDLEGHPLEGGAGQVGGAHSPVEPADEAARFLPPMRRAETGQGGNEYDAGRIGNRRSELFDVRGFLEKAETVAQPLHHRAGDESAPFQRVRHLVADLPGDGAEQSVPGGDLFRSGIHEQECPGPVGALRFALLEARLPHQRALLISRDPRDGDSVGQPAHPLGGAEDAR